jgi:hypothetical protein
MVVSQDEFEKRSLLKLNIIPVVLLGSSITFTKTAQSKSADKE